MRSRISGMAIALMISVSAVARSVMPPEATPLGGNGVQQGAGQFAAQRRALDSMVTFVFEQTNATTDQVTILFSNTPVDPKRAPRPVFGEDILQEFSFSGRDFPLGAPVKFSRRVRDRSFLDARYIRVVNHGTNGWFPTTITMSVDGQQILGNVSMYPRRGANPKGGIERWNPADWKPVFWQADLQSFRPKAY